jgi:hypothetical protein
MSVGFCLKYPGAQAIKAADSENRRSPSFSWISLSSGY